MSPWREMPWFNTPAETSFLLSSTPVQVALADPHRVVLIFAPIGGACQISTIPDPTATEGMEITTSTAQPFVLTEAQHGPLAQVAWYAFVTSGTVHLTVLEVQLREFPGER